MKKRRVQARAPSAPVAAPRSRATALVVALLAIVLAIVYANSLDNPFLADDRRAIVENPQIRALWPLDVPLSPPGESPVSRRPVVNLTFAINYAIDGVNVAGYHAGNLIIHLLSAFLLFGLVRRMLTLDHLRDRFGPHATAIAAACTAIWALHPLHTEIVNFTSQRTTALMGLFYLLTLYCSVRALHEQPRWSVFAVLACAAGMASKEAMVTAPLMVVLMDRSVLFPSWASAFRRRRWLYAGLAATWIPLAMLMRSGSRTSVGFDTGVGAWTYLMNQAAVLATYLRLTFWPRDLVVDYGTVAPVAVGEVLWPGVLIVALFTAAAVSLRFWPRAGFLGTAAFLLLAPTSSIVPIATEVGAERRMYLPLAAIVVLLVCLAYRAGTHLASVIARSGSGPVLRRARLAPYMAAGVVVVVCALLAAGVVVRNSEYDSPLTLARTTVERRPHGRAYYTLGNELLKAGHREEAIRYFRTASRSFAGGRYALGSELIADGRIDEGVDELRAFVSLDPDNAATPSARHLMALALGAQGNYETAVAELRELLRLRPDDPRALALLGELLLRMNAPARQAIAPLERAVQLRPGDARSRDILGNALAREGRLDEALTQFTLASRIDPTSESARAGRARVERLLRAPAAR